MKRLTIILCALCHLCALCAQTELTSAEAKTLYTTTSKKWVSIHDPSVVYEPQTKRYYIFGSHKAGAYTTDFKNWTQANPTWTPNTNAQAFTTPAVKTVKKGGADVSFPQFDAVNWSAKGDSEYNIDGNMWAPDVIWNEKMQKWCMYLSINGGSWHSSIVLLTATSITGPYKYQGPVVICGFKDSSHSYKDTDLELVIGTQSSLPSRYNVGNAWGTRWPHTIDPAVFYDEEGNLWMVYGSWSGGIWMLELDENTGLRDYDVTYSSDYASKGKAMTSDPYFGKRIAGGFYVSGEGPYIEHIGQYYFLFMSYGGFAPDGGYEMRVFRSEKPDGPYKDAGGRSAVFSNWVLNYGKNATDNRGTRLMGAYNNWGFMTVGECAQGHNSAIAAEDGRNYLVYHTKFNDGTAGHQVRVHQMFLNKQGWLVAAPFEYNGEEATDADVASSQLVPDADIPGVYQLLVHKYRLDHGSMEEATPVYINLNDDGTVSGDYTGTWALDPGTSYVALKLGTTTYNGVLVEEVMDQRNIKTVALTAMATSGVCVWAYKMRGDYAIAWQINNQKLPFTNGQRVAQNIDLYGMDIVADNLSLDWQSSEPDIISEYGRYNPTGLEEDTPVSLTARLTSGTYFWSQDYTVSAFSEENAKSGTEWDKGIVAHYGFDDEALANTINAGASAQLLKNGTTALPTLGDDEPLRNGNYVHLNFGANGKESYVQIPNPLYGKELADGATLSFFVKRSDNNLWDALFGFVNGDARLYMTGNLYAGFNDNAGKWIDINHPTVVENADLSVQRWHFVTVTFSRTATSATGGVTFYIDGKRKSDDKFAGKLNDTDISKKQGFDYNVIVDHIAASPYLYLGYGSFWGSPDALFDEVIVHDRALSLVEVSGLRQMVNRVFTLNVEEPDEEATGINGISDALCSGSDVSARRKAVYNLNGQRVVTAGRKGLYIVDGRKVVR